MEPAERTEEADEASLSNLSASSGSPESSEEAPAKRQALDFEELYLKNVPSAVAYEKSFMHRDVVTSVVATKTDFIVTASVDGHVKFWKKLHHEGVEFVKSFRCHAGPVTHLTVNCNGTLLCTMSTDKSLKIFDVCNFDMINMFRLGFVPSTGCWVHTAADPVSAVAVAEQDSPCIRIYDAKGTSELLYTFDKLHSKPVRIIEYNVRYEVAISVDASGMIEYWTGPRHDYKFPSQVLHWEYKTETDLYELLKAKAQACCLTFSPNGKEFVIFSDDGMIRIFRFLTGKLIKVIDESWKNYLNAKEQYKLANLDYSRRLAMEKDLYQNAGCLQFVKVLFDESGNFLIYPAMVGVKVVNWKTNRCVRIIGLPEHLRFLSVALCRAVPSSAGISVSSSDQRITSNIEIEASNRAVLRHGDPDPMIVCSAYKKNRFYLFTNCEPGTSTSENNERDVKNEKPRQEDLVTAFPEEAATKKLTESCTIHTTYGDIVCALYPKECPKTVENFATLAKRGYYNGNIFHRVIKSFIIQTGDPTGTGTGGESIWGQDFEDEFHPSLKHDRPFVLSMANCGKNTNASQFFITVCPAAHLDQKHTVFGRVVKGMEVVQNINQVKTNPKNNKPLEEVSIVSISI